MGFWENLTKEQFKKNLDKQGKSIIFYGSVEQVKMINNTLEKLINETKNNN